MDDLAVSTALLAGMLMCPWFQFVSILQLIVHTRG